MLQFAPAVVFPSRFIPLRLTLGSAGRYYRAEFSQLPVRDGLCRRALETRPQRGKYTHRRASAPVMERRLVSLPPSLSLCVIERSLIDIYVSRPMAVRAPPLILLVAGDISFSRRTRGCRAKSSPSPGRRAAAVSRDLNCVRRSISRRDA